MKRSASLPEKVLAVAQAPKLLLGQEAVIEQIAEPRPRAFVRAEVAPGDPGDGLDVAEPARSLLHVRFEVVARIAVAQMPLPLLALLGAKELAGGPHARRLDRRAHLVEQIVRPGQAPGLDQVGDHGEIAAGFRGALPDAADRVANLETEVPGHGDERFDSLVREPALERRRTLRADQHQEVDVRGRVQLSPAIAADRDQGGVTVQAEMVPCSPQCVVHRGRPLRDELAGRRPGIESRPDLDAAALERRPQAGDGGNQGRALSSWVRTSQPSGVTRIVCSHWAE